jgi:LmbE family N-acetylglucosaminyl deacetylase
MDKKKKKVAVIIAHPDDETLWAGGTILDSPSWDCFIACLCRKDDPDRAPKFARVLEILGAKGKMGNLDDGPEQTPLAENEVEGAILQLLPATRFDLIITHSINGEYTRHRRHEEIGRAVIKLWHSGKLTTDELQAFAYEDGNREYFPKPIKNAAIDHLLSRQLWEMKYNIITSVYGFDINSWEAKTTPAEEAFWHFNNADQAYQWLVTGSKNYESIITI